MMKRTYILILLLFALVISKVIAQERHTLFIGNNATYFSDWKHKPLTYFNPRIYYAYCIGTSYWLSTNLEGLYGTAVAADVGSQVGSSFVRKNRAIIDRLYFSDDVLFELVNRNQFIGLGPSVRFRFDNRVICVDPADCSTPLATRIDPNKYRLDIGLAASAGYNLPIGTRSSVKLALSYKIYSSGKSPLSVGFLYGRRW